MSDGTCSFANDSASVPVKTTSGAPAVGFTMGVTPGCQLVIHSISAKQFAAPAPFRVLRTDSGLSGSGTASVGGLVDGISVGGDTKAPDNIEPMVATVLQRIYDALGNTLYEDHTQVVYEQNHTRKTVGNLVLADGWCASGDVQVLTEIRNCFYKRDLNGPAWVGFVSGGFYRQGFRVAGVGVVSDERSMRESFWASYGSATWWCGPGATVPQHWSVECWGDVA
ncbi:MAG TPA: hypothetical protein VNA20_14335 [Frankiaceae bacterium]|nr:hypothetical protein [Frankiaceae bacterium]